MSNPTFVLTRELAKAIIEYEELSFSEGIGPDPSIIPDLMNLLLLIYETYPDLPKPVSWSKR